MIRPEHRAEGAMSQEKFPGHRLLVEAGRTGGPEQAEHNIELMRQRYEDDPADKTPAMLALTLIAWKCEEEAEVGRTAIDAHAPVTVPFWAIQALGVAWCLHRLEGMSLERAFGIGRPGQGLRSPFEKAEHQIGVLGLAREVAWVLATKGGGLESAVEEVGVRWGKSRATVMQAWKKFRKRASREVEKVVHDAHGRSDGLI
jgi:hypothetical protein